jgi:uncharacterized tellurite resistance protein B-like protein
MRQYTPDCQQTVGNQRKFFHLQAIFTAMALEKLKLLVNLARIDGDVAEREKKYVSNIGLANHVSTQEVLLLFEKNHEVVVPSNLTREERFDYIFSLVQLMKIDERLYQDEIKYCSKIAAKLGYDEEVMFDLMLHVRSVMETGEMQNLRTLTEKYLNK